MHTITEDQVTKYLQKRITETFKLKPDLNIPWQTEPTPSIEAIKKEAPLSQQQILQQSKHAAALAAAKAKASQILAAKKLQKTQKQHVVNGILMGVSPSSDANTPKKRKNRSQSGSSSRSRSSSQSSEDSRKNMSVKKKLNTSEDYICLTTDSTRNRFEKKHNGKINGKNKKHLKNIQVNSNQNGKKSYSFVNGQKVMQGSASENKLSNKLKKKMSFCSLENGDQSTESDSADEGVRVERKRQLTEKLADRQQRFQKTKVAERLCYVDDAPSVSRKNLRNIFNVSKVSCLFKHFLCQFC